MARVRAVSVSGQQHGTVFWKAGAEERLTGLGDLGPRATLGEVCAVVMGPFLVTVCAQQFHRRKLSGAGAIQN